MHAAPPSQDIASPLSIFMSRGLFKYRLDRSSLLGETVNHTEAGAQTLLMESLHPPGGVENIHDAGTGSISSRFPPPAFSAHPPPPFTSSKCHQQRKSFIIYRLTLQSPMGGGVLGEREGEQINDKWAHIMPKSAACIINGLKGEHIQRVCAHWSGGLQHTWLRDFYSCHTPCLWGGTDLVPKQSIGCSCTGSPTAGCEVPPPNFSN